MQRRLSPRAARPPDCVHRSTYVLGGRAVYTTHRQGGYPFLDVASLRVQLGQLTRPDLHQLDCSLVGCSLPPPAPRQMASLRAPARTRWSRHVASLRVQLGQLTRPDLHQLDCSLVGCSLPPPAPRQMASLRAPARSHDEEGQRHPRAVLAGSAIRCRFGETESNLGVLTIVLSNGSICRRPLPSTGSRGPDSPASPVLWGAPIPRRPSPRASVPARGGTIRAPAGSLRRTPGATSTASGLVSRCSRPGDL